MKQWTLSHRTFLSPLALLAATLGWGDNPRIHGAAMNRRLEELGWQMKRIGGGWEATSAGKPHCGTHAWTEKGKSGYNLKWRLDAVRQALGA